MPGSQRKLALQARVPTLAAAVLGVMSLGGIPRAVAQRGTVELGEDTRAARTQAAVRAQVRVDERLLAQVPTTEQFVDQTGKTVTLGELFDGTQPVVLNFAYYSCPVVCDLVLRETVRSMSQQSWALGEDFRFVSISIDPRDDAAAAAQTRASLAELFDKTVPSGFDFLTGNAEAARRVAEAVGWQYEYLPVQKEYAHPAALVLLTPGGKVARYLHGLRVDDGALRLALLEASEGKTHSVVEQALTYCYRYDPDSGGYVVVAEVMMSAGGAIVAIGLFGTLGVLWRREVRRRGRRTEQEAGGQTPSSDSVQRTGEHAGRMVRT